MKASDFDRLYRDLPRLVMVVSLKKSHRLIDTGHFTTEDMFYIVYGDTLRGPIGAEKQGQYDLGGKANLKFQGYKEL